MPRPKLTIIVLMLGLFASACLVIGGCDSDRHDIHVLTSVGVAR